jgi:hypothetical protein
VTDPLDQFRRRLRLVGATVSIALLAALGWSIMPLTHAAPPVANEIPPRAVPTGCAASPLDTSVFDATLWYVPPKPAAAPKPPPAPPAPKPPAIDLLAIERDEKGLAAAVYDRVGDFIVLLRLGDQLQGHLVSAMTDDGLTLSRDRTEHRFSMKEAAK